MRPQQSSSHHILDLARVTGSLLILARTAQNRLAPELSDVPVHELLAAVQALVKPAAALQGVSVAVDDDHGPAVVRGERTALIWVLTNLAGNAVKLTPRGGRVSLSAVILPNAVELRVAYTGPAIRSIRLETELEPFVPVHITVGGKRREEEGELSIARELTRLMGGELVVRTAGATQTLLAMRFQSAWHPAQRCAGVPMAKAA
jgi:signal transduction histidine kinase